MVLYFPENKCVRVAHNRTEPGDNGLKLTTIFKEVDLTYYILSVGVLLDSNVENLIQRNCC